jgi:hypothetical protein
VFFQSLKHRKLRRISLKHASNGDFGTILGKRKKCHETQDISIFCMFAVCKKHAPKEHSGLQSCMEFRGFRANVSPLATYIYILIILYIYTHIHIRYSIFANVFLSNAFLWSPHHRDRLSDLRPQRGAVMVLLQESDFLVRR